MSYQKPQRLSNTKLVDLVIRQRTLLIFICRQLGVNYHDYDDIDVLKVPDETLEATRWAESAIYGGVE